MEDTWAWNYEQNGRFIVWSAYRMLADTKRRSEDWLENNPGRSNYEEEAKAWTSLWSVQALGKIRSFLLEISQMFYPNRGRTPNRTWQTMKSVNFAVHMIHGATPFCSGQCQGVYGL